MSGGMNDLSGWRMISCKERGDLLTGDLLTGGLRVMSSEWGLDGVAVLRDYHWPDDRDRPCQHWVPGGDES